MNLPVSLSHEFHMATCNSLIVFKGYQCFLSSPGIPNIWKGVNGPLQEGNFCLQLIMSTHGLKWRKAWVAVECIHSTYDGCLRVPFFSDPLPFISFPLSLIPSFSAVSSVFSSPPFWRDFSKFVASSWMIDQHGQFFCFTATGSP